MLTGLLFETVALKIALLIPNNVVAETRVAC